MPPCLHASMPPPPPLHPASTLPPTLPSPSLSCFPVFFPPYLPSTIQSRQQEWLWCKGGMRRDEREAWALDGVLLRCRFLLPMRYQMRQGSGAYALAHRDFLCNRTRFPCEERSSRNTPDYRRQNSFTGVPAFLSILHTGELYGAAVG